MSSLLARWLALKAYYASLPRRDRLLSAIALVLVPLLLGNALWLEPQRSQAAQLAAEIARLEASSADFQGQVSLLDQQLQGDPDAARKAELSALQAQIAALDHEMQSFGAALVAPEEMNDLLGHLLSKNAGLRLISLKTVPARSVLAAVVADVVKDKGATAKLPMRVFDLFRHGVEIRVEGKFGDLLNYVAQIEAERSRMVLEKLSYQVIEYPNAEMVLTIYTLSAEKAWLSL